MCFTAVAAVFAITILSRVFPMRSARLKVLFIFFITDYEHPLAEWTSGGGHCTPSDYVKIHISL